MLKVQKWSQQIPKPQPPNTNTIYSCTFNTDGSLLFVAISQILVVYNAENGEVVTKPTKAAKQPINCIVFAKDGKTFATTSNDRTCVLWRFNIQSQKKIQPFLKLTQNDSILTLSFNPLTHQLFSGGAADFALWTPGKKEIPKEKFREKIICSAWSADGQTIAFGSIVGTLSFRQRNLEEKNQLKLDAAVWCMDWSPITGQNQVSYLLVGCWDQTFYYFNGQGERKQKFSERHIPCNPISINFHHSGEYFLVASTDKKVSLYSKDLGFLTDLTTLNDWSWCSKFRPKSQQIAITTNSGLITMHQLSKQSISSCHHQLFAKRDNFTDVIVENIALNQKLRIKCKQLVKKISVFKDKLGVLQKQRVLIYIACQEGLKYSPYRKITKTFDCDNMQILNSHALFTKEKKIFVYNFLGELERQWIMEADITYLKTVGGPPKRQHAIIGLNNGQVLKIFVDNSFPIQLYRASGAVTKCELSVSKKRLAILDINKNLVAYDLISQTQLYQEINVDSFAWNSDLDDSIGFSSNGIVSIKTGSLAPLTQKSSATIIGFEGFQLFIMKDQIITVMDISQSSTLAKYVEKKQFQIAYKLACLGVPETDMRFLGIQALQNHVFDVAQKCFTRLKDLPFLDLTKNYIQEYKKNGKVNGDILKAQLLSYQGKYQQAASSYMKAGKTNLVIELFCQLKKFEEAQRYIRMSNETDHGKILKDLFQKQAKWAKVNGDYKQAAQLYIKAKDYKEALDIYTKQKDMDGLIEVCRIINKQGNQDMLQTCATLFKTNKEHTYAKQIYLKLNNMKSLMNLHIEMQKWQDAFLLGKQNHQLLEIVKLPYANYLIKKDKYEEAIRAFKKINRPDLIHKIINSLSQVAVNEKRFIEASRQYWSLAIQELKLIKNFKKPAENDEFHIKKYQQLSQISQMYYAYNSIADFVQIPFFSSSDAALYAILNTCRFLITKLSKYKLPYINASYIFYSLAKVSFKLQGYKTARSCYDKLSQLIVNNKWTDQMQLGSLTVRSKPFTDKDSILPVCPRCSMSNPVISQSNSCFNCKHPFILSFMSFQVLPLVQFRPQKTLTHNKMIELLNTEKKSTSQQKINSKYKKDDGWNQTLTSNQQVLSQNNSNNNDKTQKFTIDIKNSVLQTLENQQMQVDYIPVQLGQKQISELEPELVYLIDQRKMNSNLPIRYFINIISDVLFKCCMECGKFFLLDQYEFQFVQNKKCPYCGSQEKRSGRTKDIFDL